MLERPSMGRGAGRTWVAVVAIGVVALLAGCSDDRTQGAVTGHRIPCVGPTSDTAAQFCKAELTEFLHRNPDTRIAGINAVHEGGPIELIAWTTANRHWPRADALTVDEEFCLRGQHGAPDCVSGIARLSFPLAHEQHVFLVPLFAGHDKDVGSWSFLDVKLKDDARSVGWHHVDITEVPCRLGPGDTWYVDVRGEGVRNATEMLREDREDFTPIACEPALLGYLRKHPDERIIDVVPVDSAPAVLNYSFPGTSSLLLLSDDSDPQWPRAGDLSLYELACDRDCAQRFLDTRNSEPWLSTGLLTIPVAESMPGEGTRVAQLIVLSLAK